MQRTSLRVLVSAVVGLTLVPLVATARAADASSSSIDSASIPSTPARAPEPPREYRLVYRFRPNQLVYYDVTHKSRVHVKADGASQKTTNETHTRKHYRVVSVDSSGSGLLELVLDRVRMRVQFGDSDPVVFDSTDSLKSIPRQFQAIKRSIGVPQARMRFAADGELVKAQRLRRAPAIGQLDNAPKTPENDRTHNFLIEFPDRELSPGDTWKERLTVRVRLEKSLLRPVTLLRKFRLESVRGHLATISMRTTVLTPIRDPDIRTQLIQRTPKGTIVFDIEKGLIVSKRLTVDKREVGLFGGKGSMHVTSRRSQKLVDPEALADRDDEAARK